MLLPLTRLGIIASVLFLLPWLALIFLGGYWLWQHEWLYHALGIISANLALIYCLLSWRGYKRKSVFIEPISIEPNPNWPDYAQSIWPEIERLSERFQAKTDSLTNINGLLQLTNTVLTLVSRHFHADSKYPILEFPLPYLLKLIVLVCNDIQHEVLDKIPGSHAVRVGDLVRIKKGINTVNNIKSILSVGNWLFNWSGAAMTKSREILLSKGINTVTTEISKRVINAYIKKVGYYAIQLYSGQLILDDIVSSDSLCSYSTNDIAEYQEREQSVEPLRFMIMGQVSSGKSSLINALFGEIKSASGFLPTTSDITPYVLERDGLKHAIILDTTGYGGVMVEQPSAALKKEWTKTDVIIVVCNAAQATRQVDAKQLGVIRNFFQQEKLNQSLPVILAVATHIDRLRPLHEWQPPYQIQHPDTNNTKAFNIQQACITIARELSLPLDCVVPVCLAPEFPPYNIEDGLLPLIHEHLNAAQRVRYLRCLRQQQSESYWRHWRKQALKAGKLILDRV